MIGHFRLENPKFDGVNYDNWKEKMKNHLLCMGTRYWLMTKNRKKIEEERKLEECSEVERDLFIYNMLAREALLSALPENEYSQVKPLEMSHVIWKALEFTFEGDLHAKRIRLYNWICLFQDSMMMEDKFVRSYIGRISKNVVGIKSFNGSNNEDEIIWNILKTLTPPFNRKCE